MIESLKKLQTSDAPIIEPAEMQATTDKPIEDLLHPVMPKSHIGLPLITGFLAGLAGAVLGLWVLFLIPQFNTMFQNKDLSARTEALEAANHNYVELSVVKAANERVAKLETQISAITDLSARLEKLEALPTESAQVHSSQTSTALLVATDALRRKFEAGASFVNEFKAVQSWVDPSLNLAALKIHAQLGVKDMRSLANSFDGLRNTLLTDSSTSTGLLDSMSNLVKVRPANEVKASDPQSLITRIYASLLHNQAGQALDDLVKLPEPALTRLQPIIKDLKARVDVEAAIRALEQNALQHLIVQPN